MYRLIGSSSPESLASDGDLQYDTVPTRQRWYTSIGHVSVIICIACTVVNAILTVRSEFYKRPQIQTVPFSAKDISRLRRPSQYIRFDEIKRPSPPIPKQFVNHPIALTQIDASAREKVFEDDPRRYLAHVGTISPEDRQVLVTDTVSTVIQFRAFDWGMESCQLHLSLSQNKSTSLLLPGQSFLLSLYQLNATVALDVSELSYTTRPPRMSKVAVIPFAYGQETLWSRKFFCKTEELVTFELGCSGFESDDGRCHVNWWQDKKVKHADPAIYMVQHSTA